MRTSMTKWFKFSLVALICFSMVSIAGADDKDKKSQPKTKEDRAAIKLKKAEERRLSRLSKSQTAVEGFEEVDMFEAMKSNDIEVKILTKSASDSNFVVTNNTDKPLAVHMPAAFSAVPVMRQGFGGGGGGLGGGQGGGGGVFNIPAGKVGRMSVKTVCLEEGKPDPKPQVKYVVQPLEELNADPKIFELCRMLATDEVAQPVAQASAWNIANGIPWETLLTKNRVEHMDGSFERFFHPNQLRIAQQVVSATAQRAVERSRSVPSLDSLKYPVETKNDRYNADGSLAR